MSDWFKERQLKKKTEFVELIHAAALLDTSVTFYLSKPQPTEKELSWVAYVYPNSTISQGTDQGAKYCTITPSF